MLDWNGNGRIDPVDVGISIAAQEEQGESESTEVEHLSPDSQPHAQRDSLIKRLAALLFHKQL